MNLNIPQIEEIFSDQLKKLDNSTDIEVKNIDRFKKEIKNILKKKLIKRSAVLGIDIYKYSKYEEFSQPFIPILFDRIYAQTIKDCYNFEPYIFNLSNNIQDSDEKQSKFKDFFISTGDGGFQIFPTPFLALIFLIYFQSNLHCYNTYSKFNNFRKFCGEITLRYAITYDQLYYYKKNYYGKAIINNARIMSNDKLDRILIDENSYHWFEKKINGIETISIINSLDTIDILKEKKGNVFCSLDSIKQVSKDTLLFGNINAIKNCICQKIKEVAIKDNKFSIYNIYLQIILSNNSATKVSKNFVIPAGNLNPHGLDV